MNRRKFITTVGTVSVAVGLSSIIKAEETVSSTTNNLSVNDEEISSLPGDVDKTIFKISL